MEPVCSALEVKSSSSSYAIASEINPFIKKLFNTENPRTSFDKNIEVARNGTNTSGSWVSNNFCDFDTLKNVLSQFKGKRMIFSITSNYDLDTNNIYLYYNIGGTSTYITPNPREAEFVVPNNIDTATSITVPIGVNGPS